METKDVLTGIAIGFLGSMLWNNYKASKTPPPPPASSNLLPPPAANPKAVLVDQLMRAARYPEDQRAYLMKQDEAWLKSMLAWY